MTHVGEGIRPPEDETVPLGRVVVYCLAIMIIAAAIIHFAVAAKYVEQYWLFGASTLVVAWLQALWAIAVIARPSRHLHRLCHRPELRAPARAARGSLLAGQGGTVGSGVSGSGRTVTPAA